MSGLVSKQIVVIVASVALDLLPVVAFALRCYSIVLVRRRIASHDVLCFVSLIMLQGYTIDMLIGTISGGIGVHIRNVSPPQLRIARKTFFASQFLWAISIACFRLAMLDLYIKTFPTPKFRLAARGAMAIVILFFIGCIATTLRMCAPIAFNWNSSIDGSCGDVGTAELAAAAFNLVLDVIIVLLPCRIVWGLQMSVQKRAAVMATFGLGLCISGINLARIVEVLACDLLDFTYCTADSVILTVAEPAVGIIVVCIPTLGPVLFPKRRKRFTRIYSHKPYPSPGSNSSDGRRGEWDSMESRNGSAAAATLTPARHLPTRYGYGFGREEHDLQTEVSVADAELRDAYARPDAISVQYKLESSVGFQSERKKESA